MKLVDKFDDALEHSTPVRFALRCEQIADDYSIGFAEWMVSGVEFMDDTERGRVYYFKKKLYTTQELLEIYKKEIGL